MLKKKGQVLGSAPSLPTCRLYHMLLAVVSAGVLQDKRLSFLKGGVAALGRTELGQSRPIIRKVS